MQEDTASAAALPAVSTQPAGIEQVSANELVQGEKSASVVENMDTRVVVEGLDPNTPAAALHQHFAMCGLVQRLKMVPVRLDTYIVECPSTLDTLPQWCVSSNFYTKMHMFYLSGSGFP